MTHRFTALVRLLLALLVAWQLTSPATAQEMSNPTFPEPEEAWSVPNLPEGWITQRTPAFEVNGHVDHVAVLDRLAAHGARSLPRLATALGVPIGGTIRVYLADDPETFARLQPGRPPWWADGTAWPDRGVIFLRHPKLRPVTAQPLEVVLDHELLHILLGRAFAPQPTPHWLQEGIAQVYAGEVGPDLPSRISRGLVGTAPLSLEQLTTSFPREPAAAALAYAQTADFVQWYREQWGEDAIRRLIRETAAGRPLSAVILGVTGQTLPALDATWQARLVATTPVWTAPENLEAALWGVGGALLVAGGWSRRRAFRRRMLAWQDHDRGLDRLARLILQRRTP